MPIVYMGIMMPIVPPPFGPVGMWPAPPTGGLIPGTGPGYVITN